MAATDRMDVDIDFDFGGDEYMGPEPDTQLQTLPEPAATPREIPEAYLDDSVPEKVHIRGLDSLSTEDIKDFAAEHYPDQLPTRIEWIDDTSANIVYPTITTATRALIAFTDPTLEDAALIAPPNLRNGKHLSTKPDVNLEVRQSNAGDVKKRNARDASRYYLMNPDKDPANRPRRYDDRRAGRGRFDRPGYSDRPPKRRRSMEEESVPFDVNMYDEDAVPDEPKAQLSRDQSDRGHREKRVRFGGGNDGYGSGNDGHGSGFDRGYHHTNDRYGGGTDRGYDRGSDGYGGGYERGYDRDYDRGYRGGYGRSEDLFADRLGRGSGNGRELMRPRSASPDRMLADGDGRYGFAEPVQHIANDEEARFPRMTTRRTSATSNNNDNATKELFPTTNGTSNFRPSSSSSSSRHAQAPKELFPTRSSPIRPDFHQPNAGKELFGNTNGGSPAHHRRSEAFDARDNSNDLFPRASGSGSGTGSVGGGGGAHMDRIISPGRPRSHGLAERISGGPGSRESAQQVRQRTSMRTNPKAKSYEDNENETSSSSNGLRIRGSGAHLARTSSFTARSNDNSRRNSATSPDDENPGFTIRGVAKGLNPRVKELFPQKVGSGSDAAQGDLFADKMKGRAGGRSRAEDLFGH